MKKILVIGSMNIDFVTNVEHIPVVGETILGDDLEMIPGGKGANQACAAGKLLGNVSMLGAVGDDIYADVQLRSLQNAGVDITHTLKRKGVNTGVAWITVNREGDNNIIVVPGANKTISREDIDNNKKLIEESDIILLQLEIPIDTVCYAAKVAKDMGKTVILDPAPAPIDFPDELYRYVDMVKPNETELSILTGVEDIENHLEEATNQLRDKGVRCVIVTLGGSGVYVNSDVEGIFKIPGVKVDAIDTTAAGDSFTAALAVRLAKDESLLSAVKYANTVASIVVTRKGAQSSIPDYDEVDTVIMQNRA